MALKQANTLAPSNVSASGFALADARHIGGHRVVASLAALYALQDWQLLNPDETDTAMALGQQWYVKGDGFYRLTNWGSRKAAGGWTKVVDPNNIDTTLFQIVSALPTSGINKNRIYIVASANRDPNGKNIYAEYIYTGDTSATYDATKWEKLGEYTPTVDLSPYMKLEQKGVANGVATLDASGKVTDEQLWDATNEKHGLMTADEKKAVASYVSKRDGGDFVDVCKFHYEKENVSDSLIEDAKCPLDPDMEIVYATNKKRFYAMSQGLFYTDWGSRDSTFGADATPSPGKLYVAHYYVTIQGAKTQPPVLYIGDRINGLSKIAKMDDIQVMTNEEIDALFV